MFGSSTPATTTPFGAQASSSIFPTTNSSVSQGFGSSAFGAASSSANNGTANPPFSVVTEKDGPAGTTGTNLYQSITSMPAYSASSFEELRVQDYNQNRKSGTATANTGFGSGSFNSNSANTNNIFGATQPQASPFGQTAATSSTPMFGQSNNTPGSTLFGATANTSTAPFGQSGTMFGRNTSTPATTGLFGATNTSSSAFGGNANGAQTSTPFGQSTGNPFGGSQNTGGFGSNNTSTTNAFGQNNSAAAKPFTFGSAASPASGFGQTNLGTTNVGSNNPFGSAPTSTTGLFSSNPTNNTTPNNAFGGMTSNTPAGGGFSFGGNNTNNATTNAGTFGFGGASTQNSGNTQKPFSFGTPASGTSGTFGATAPKPFAFGQSSNTPNLSSNGTGLFGSGNTTSSPAGTSLFGANKPTTNLFGSNTTTNQSNNNATTGTNLFGKPATNSLFSGGNSQFSTGPGLFNNGQSQNPGLFAGNASGAQQNSGMQFNQSQQGSGQPFQASINGNAYGNNPLFTSVQLNSSVNSKSPGPIATPLVANSAKKKLANLPHFKLAARSPSSSTRLFGKSMSAIDSPSSTTRRPAFSIFDEELLMSPEAFSPRSNIKKLVIERRPDEVDLLSGGLDLRGSSAGPPKENETPRPTRDRRKPHTEPEEEASAPTETPQTTSDSSLKSNQNGEETDSKKATSGTVKSNDAVTNNIQPQTTNSSYWTSPPIDVLLDLSKAELSKVRDFKVGRRGYGQISFSSVVDLSTLERLEDVTGNIVTFERKLCTVYPDERLKPPAGKGLNVPATVTLENCFPLSKDKREPIRDPNHPRFQQHVDRLKRMSETTFVDYLADSGTWIFQVKQF